MESYLGPGFSRHGLLLNEVALHSLSSVALWRFPGESAGSSRHVAHLQVSGRSRQVCGCTGTSVDFLLNFSSWSWRRKCLNQLTEHIDSDFEHFVSGGALSIDDVPAAVVHFALWYHNHRGGVGGVDLRITAA